MTLPLHSKATLPAAMLAATAIAYLGIYPKTDAGVIWLVSDNGTDLTMTTDGGSIFLDGYTSYLLDASPGTSSGSVSDTWGGAIPEDPLFQIEQLNNDNYWGLMAGEPTGNPWWIAADSTASSVSGHSFGGTLDGIYWDASFGKTISGSITPISSMTFSGLTIATAFGTNLDSGPVVIWEDTDTGETISVQAVPEPSSSASAAVGMMFLMLRRRRK